VDQITALFREGLSIREVSRRTGIGFGVVWAHLIRCGLHRVQHRHIRNGLAVCRRCGRRQPKEEFPELCYSKYCCQDCLLETNRQAQARRQGCTPEQYQALLDKQNGRCAICGAPDGHRSCRGKKCRLAIDHDHRTGAIRGLLCNSCNRGLGRFKDSIAILESALRYLKREQ